MIPTDSLRLVAASLTLAMLICSSSGTSYPFDNPSLSWRERVDDLVQRLTVDEITLQMAHGGRNTHAPGIDRLGIKPYPWGSECLRGDVQAGPATSFPQALGLAATFSPRVVFNVSRATGVEVRAKYNNYSSHGDVGQHTSASCWSPVINIMRDPRWGRNQETYGEDPYMSGVLATAFVRGLQGDHDRYIQANAGCKHFDVYAGPENRPIDRHHFDAMVSERDWRMTFLPAFKACVEAGTYSLMCSYNSINGIPACASKKLLTDILRGEWGFNGYVISDEGAIEDIMDTHKYTNSLPDTAAAAVNAGTNLEDGGGGRSPYFLAISDAVKQGKIEEGFLREAVKPLFYTRMRLGLFDPPEMNPFAKLDPSVVVQSSEHRELSLLTALRSFVMLKNHNSFLPLPMGKRFATVAIVGPAADNTDVIFGGYAPDPDPKYVITPRAGLSVMASQIAKYDSGCKGVSCDTYDGPGVKIAVTGADIVFVALGTGCDIECESNDRGDINLPGHQLQLLQDAVKYSNGAPVVLLLFNAGPLDISWAVQNDQVVAIIECFFPAQSAGEAIRFMLYGYGPASNPAGRLPATWPATMNNFPAITNYSMVGRTYRYAEVDPLFPFGFGLSYTSFYYRSLDVRPSRVLPTNPIFIDVYVQNTGSRDGEEVVQAYISWPASVSIPVPKLQLVGFDRFFIPSGQGVSCQFKVTLEQLAVWDDQLGFVTPPGEYIVYVGGQQPNQKVNVGSNVLKSLFTVIQPHL